MKGKAAALLFLLFLPPSARCAIPEKPLGFVSDFAGILDAGTAAALTAQIAETERQTTAEIAVVTVSSLEGRSVEDFANELFRKWGLGKKGKDNGVLVLVAPQERKVR